ncbi:MAG TPA: DUF5943 domain-containing protein [Stellaceae bacterium]|nr:DUF5943 domain-containing protein [Stellaceae bacterium]
MAELPVPVAVDAKTGAWSVDGQPVILVPRHFWAFVQMECERKFGIEGTREVYDAATRKAARVWCEREARTHGLAGVAVFRHYLDRMSRRGWARMTIETVDPAAGTAQIRLDHSALAAEYGAQAGRRVCYMFAAAFEGAMEWVAETAGAAGRLEAFETQCAAEGAPCCRFQVRPHG